MINDGSWVPAEYSNRLHTVLYVNSKFEITNVPVTLIAQSPNPLLDTTLQPCRIVSYGSRIVHVRFSPCQNPAPVSETQPPCVILPEPTWLW